jgi:hypothetical protein
MVLTFEPVTKSYEVLFQMLSHCLQVPAQKIIKESVLIAICGTFLKNKQSYEGV